MRGVVSVVQGKKGTGADKTQLAFRCPGDLYRRLDSGVGSGGSMTTRVLAALQDAVDIEEEAGDRLRELRAQKELEGVSLGRVLVRLALEALDARRKGKK